MSARAEITSAAREIVAAGEAYRAGDYAAAVARYEAAIDAGADGADVFFNLGNALYRAGETGRAALAFERALRRDPGDEGARANLELVRARSAEAGVRAAAPTLVERLGARVEPGDAGAILLVTWSLACAAFILRRALRRGALRAACTAALVLLCLASAGAGVAQYAAWRVREAGWAVVVEAGDALQAPDPGASPVAALPAGLRVRAPRRIGDWALVEFDDRQGWIEASRVEPID